MKTKCTSVVTGDLMAFIYYGKVTGVREGGSKLSILDLDNNQHMDVNGAGLVEKAMSADQYHETVKGTKTSLAELLINAGQKPFTVCFKKADDSYRILRGRLVSTEPLLGRSRVEDLDAEGNRLRLVDHRTIEELILDGVKYTLK